MPIFIISFAIFIQAFAIVVDLSDPKFHIKKTDADVDGDTKITNTTEETEEQQCIPSQYSKMYDINSKVRGYLISKIKRITKEISKTPENEYLIFIRGIMYYHLHEYGLANTDIKKSMNKQECFRDLKILHNKKNEYSSPSEILEESQEKSIAILKENQIITTYGDTNWHKYVGSNIINPVFGYSIRNAIIATPQFAIIPTNSDNTTCIIQKNISGYTKQVTAMTANLSNTTDPYKLSSYYFCMGFSTLMTLDTSSPKDVQLGIIKKTQNLIDTAINTSNKYAIQTIKDDIIDAIISKYNEIVISVVGADFANSSMASLKDGSSIEHLRNGANTKLNEIQNATPTQSIPDAHVNTSPGIITSNQANKAQSFLSHTPQEIATKPLTFDEGHTAISNVTELGRTIESLGTLFQN